MLHSPKNLRVKLLILAILAQSCSNSSTPNQETAINTSELATQVEIDGSSTVKEIIIRTNKKLTTPSYFKSLLSPFHSKIRTTTTGFNLEAQDLILDKIKKSRTEINESLYAKSGKANAFTPENFVDLATGLGAGIAGIMFPPGSAVLSASMLVFGGSALKNQITDQRQSNYETAFANLKNRQDRAILLLSINEAKYAGDTFFENLSAGTDPKILKNKIYQYQQEILSKTNMTPDEMGIFLKNSNDNFLLGAALTIKDNQDLLSRDTKQIINSLKETNILIKDLKQSTTLLLEKQNKVLEKIQEYFAPDEQKIIINALFDPANNNKDAIILSADQLTFFKNNPEQLQVFKQFISNDPSKIEKLRKIIEIEKSAQNAYAYLQVTTQIANNVNLNPEIINALNKGSSIASATTSIAAFLVSSNPLEALNAVSAISSMFNHPKPDPRFTAIFENFKTIQTELNFISNQIQLLDQKLNNMDQGLKYIISQNQTILEFNAETYNAPLNDCQDTTNNLEALSKTDGLNYLHVKKIFTDTHQGNSEKINRCLNYLSDTFQDSLTYKKIKFSEKVSHENLSSDDELYDYYQSLDVLNNTYNVLAPLASERLTKADTISNHILLSTNSIISHVRQLLANQFLFDLTLYNRTTHNWELVEYRDLNKNITMNKKSEELLKDALKLLNLAIIQHSIVDGAILSDKEVYMFTTTKLADCHLSPKNIACLAINNEVLAQNLLKASFETLITKEYYQAWNKLALNNPDHLNDRLAKTPLKVVWVGSGASDLYTGEKIENNNLTAGAYIKIANSQKLLKLPELNSLNKKLSFKSTRLNLLIDYKNAIEKELVERKLNQILSVQELQTYNKTFENQLGY